MLHFADFDALLLVKLPPADDDDDDIPEWEEVIDVRSALRNIIKIGEFIEFCFLFDKIAAKKPEARSATGPFDVLF